LFWLQRSMGCTASKPETDEKTSRLDAYLDQQSAVDNATFKILLLGAGESGKSTVVKQLKSIYKLPIDAVELQSFATNMHRNTVQSMQTFIEAALTLEIPFTDAEDQRRATEVEDFVFDAETKRMPVAIADDIAALWQSDTIQQTYKRRSEFYFLDASEYYFTNVQRMVAEDFTPSEEDMVMTRIRTTGISVTEFTEGNVMYRVVDVGGQRSERRKWIHCFDDVKALLFVVSLAGYDQVMFEDPTQNRMHEQLALFAQIVNTAQFKNTPIFVFLNKKDLFEQMMRTTPLSKCFPEYTGGDDVQAALEFIKQQFISKVQDQPKVLHFAYVSARFKKDIRWAWDEVKETMGEVYKSAIAKAAKDLKRAGSKGEITPF